MTQDYFPAKLAKGDRFCNRKLEKQQLKASVEKGRHTVLLSPRRYGKSSLAHKVVDEMKLPFVSVDLFLANNDAAITRRIMEGIANAVSQLLPPTEKLLETVQKAFRHFKVSLSVQHFNIEADFSKGAANSVDQIFNALKGLAEIAASKNKKVIFFIDEFQDIASSENSKAIQGAIRHVAQETDNIVFIFSGSHRNLLLELFDDQSMPLYMLCDKIELNRMSSADYHSYIQNAAQQRWKKPIDERAFNLMMQVTELHPFYVNMLGNELWQISNELPNYDAVAKGWERCYEIEKRRLVAELDSLTTNQQNFLKALALSPTSEPTGQKFSLLTNMASSSLNQTIKLLLARDMIYTAAIEDNALPTLRKGQLRVLDPLLAYALRKYE